MTSPDDLEPVFGSPAVDAARKRQMCIERPSAPRERLPRVPAPIHPHARAVRGVCGVKAGWPVQMEREPR
jgi:hypothetical protein